MAGRGEPSFWTSRPFRLLIVVLVLGLSLAIFLLRDRFTEVAGWGYPGIFLVSLLGNATIILPAPSLALVFAMGSVLPPLLVGLTAGVGETLGELSGYAAGYSGRAVIQNRAAYVRLEGHMRRAGDLTILILSVVPNPFFDLAGIAAGALHLPIWRFLLFCWVGKTIKTTLVASAGAWGFTLIEPLLG